MNTIKRLLKRTVPYLLTRSINTIGTKILDFYTTVGSQTKVNGMAKIRTIFWWTLCSTQRLLMG